MAVSGFSPLLVPLLIWFNFLWHFTYSQIHHTSLGPFTLGSFSCCWFGPRSTRYCVWVWPAAPLQCLGDRHFPPRGKSVLAMLFLLWVNLFSSPFLFIIFPNFPVLGVGCAQHQSQAAAGRSGGPPTPPGGVSRAAQPSWGCGDLSICLPNHRRLLLLPGLGTARWVAQHWSTQYWPTTRGGRVIHRC